MKVLYVVLLMFCTQFGFSQIVDKNETILKINNDSKNFLVKEKEIDTSNDNERFYIKEIIEKKEIGYNLKGVYRLYTNKSPSFTYLILKDGDKFQIIDLIKFSKALKKISDFLYSNFEDKIIVQYLEEIIRIYQYNRYDEKIKM